MAPKQIWISFQRINPKIILAIFLVYKIQLACCQVSFSPSTNTRGLNKLILNNTINFTLEWEINPGNTVITFNIESSSDGYLALALSKYGSLEGADVMVTGIANDGNAYVHDMFGVDNQTIGSDQKQDWRIVNATKNLGRSAISIQRRLDTCDDQDIIIEKNPIRLKWNSGEDHNLPVQFTTDQSEERIVNFDTRLNENFENIQSWRLFRRTVVPPRHTSYWCTIHKGPSLRSRHHLTGYNQYFRDKLARKHVHHTVVYRCSVPIGYTPAAIFEPFLTHPGEECYLSEQPQLPALCREMVAVWGIGGPPLTFPSDLGIPIGYSPTEYFMYETHLDNPDVESNLVIDIGMDLNYTSVLRPNEGGLMLMGSGILGAFGVPPGVPKFNIVGHCSPKCTSEVVPLTGMQIVGVNLHAHTAARAMRLRHFRGIRELPWVSHEGNYNFPIQEMRLLANPPTILPGDQLTVECTYSSEGKNTSVVSGFSTQGEMCTAFVLVNKKIPALYCTSEIPTERVMAKFGIRNMTWDVEINERIVNAANNPNLVGLPFSEVVAKYRNWTDQEITAYEMEQMYSDQSTTCPNLNLVLLAYRLSAVERLLSIDIPFVTGTGASSTIRDISTPAIFPMYSAMPRNFIPYSPAQCTENVPLTSTPRSLPSNPIGTTPAPTVPPNDPITIETQTIRPSPITVTAPTIGPTNPVTITIDPTNPVIVPTASTFPNNPTPVPNISNINIQFGVQRGNIPYYGRGGQRTGRFRFLGEPAPVEKEAV